MTCGWAKIRSALIIYCYLDLVPVYSTVLQEVIWTCQNLAYHISINLGSGTVRYIWVYITKLRLPFKHFTLVEQPLSWPPTTFIHR